jgi:hypothetical protein
MAIINKTGITNGGTIQAEHVTRTIDALSGVSTDTIVATGSFSGSFKGTLNGGADTAGAVNTLTNSIENQSYYITSVAASTGNQTLYTDSTLTFNPNTNALTLTGSAIISSSLTVQGVINTTELSTTDLAADSGTLTITANAQSVVDLSAISSSGQFAIPLIEPQAPSIGAMYFETATGKLKLWDGSVWQQWAPD